MHRPAVGISMPGKQTLISCALLAVVTLALYAPVVRFPFTDYDDPVYVTNNLHVQGGLSWTTFGWAWTATEAENWHPLTWLSHALDWQLYGPNPAGHHVTSVALHILNSLLLFLLLLRTTGYRWRSLLVAALFALHPLNVESVAWVAERKNVLSTVFLFLALGAYGRYARQPDIGRYLVMTALFVLGLAAKPMVITLPFLLLLLDIWPFRRIQGWGPLPSPTGSKPLKKSNERISVIHQNAGTWFRVPQSPLSRLVIEKLPLLLFCVASAVITIIAQRTNALRSLVKYPLELRIENAVYSYAMYVWKAFWPTRLAVLYPHPGSSLSVLQLAIAAIFLVALSVFVWNQRTPRPYFLAGWLWYVVTLIPVIGIVQVGDQARADRYAYVPLIGIFIMVVWGAADLAHSRNIDLPKQAALALLVLAALSFLTWRQIGHWRSAYDLWSHTVGVTAENPVAEEKLSIALAALDRDEEAIPGFEKAVRANPADPTRHANLGQELMAVGRWQDALAEYQTAIQLTSTASHYPGWKQTSARTVRARCYQSLATIYSELGDYSNMHESYRQALKIDPQLAPDMVDQITSYAESEPSGKHYLQLAVLLQELGHLQTARAAYEKALNLDSSLEEAKKSLATLPPGQN